MIRPDSDPLWFKDAVIYQVHVRAFSDSTGDGVGDFPGLASKLAYIRDLGVSCVWLLPFYPSPLRDDGYDIAHYEGVHPSYGTLKDFRAFLRAAHDAGLQVITELVINHTSDQHPWFQAARRARGGSSKRDFYVWSDDPHRYGQARIIFSDTESSNWAWDPVAGAYYWHRFFHHQPDLNFDNPRVTRAVTKVMRFWLDMGVDGMRLDAVPYLIERDGTNCESLPETHAVLKRLRSTMDQHYSHRLLLAEANQWPGDVRAYFGDGDECHMAFHFPLMPRIYMALKQEDRHPIVDVITQTPDLPETCQWAIFLRNHDELTLEMVTDEERDYLRQAYASDPQMRVNGGIRRRLAPLLENDRQRIELLNALLFSLPGTPIVYYGDEIGMGDNIYLGDRNGVRTPMHWTSDRNAGFSKADPARLYAPPIMDAVYGYQVVNVEAQERSPSSLLHWMRRLIALRRRHRTFGRGTIRFLSPANRKVLAFVREYEGETILCIANLSRHAQPVELDLSGHAGRVPVEMLGDTEFPRIGELPYFVTLGPYASYWFLLRETVEPPPPARPVPRSAPKPPDALDLRPLLLGLDWSSAFDTATHEILERDYLPVHLATRRWFAGAARRLRSVRIRDHIRLGDSTEPAFVTLLDVSFDDGATETYFLPVGFLSGDAAETLLRESPDLVIARVSGARKGVLHERLDYGVIERLLAAMRGGQTTAGRYGRLVGSTTESVEWPPELETAGATRLNAEQRNTSFVFGERVITKLIRRVEPGPHPELEMGRHLTDRVPFDGAPPLLGALEYENRDGQRTTLMLAHAYEQHRGTAWDQAIDELGRYFEAASTSTDAPTPGSAAVVDRIGWYADAVRQLGRRTAGLHQALATAAGDDAFTPAPLTRGDLERLAARAVSIARALPQTIAHVRDTATHPDMLTARVALERLPALEATMARLIDAVPPGALAIRTHGDYHLGQVLVRDAAFTIVDFEGDAASTIADRRRKRSPFDDVAAMLRSFSRAAYSGLATWADRHPEQADRLRPWARVWEVGVQDLFLRSYLESTDPAWDLDGPGRDPLLRLHLIAKTVDDLGEELDPRPAWAPVPLIGLAELLE